MNLRYYQQDIAEQIHASSDDVLVQLDTGAGKTPIMAHIAKSEDHFIVLAHRNVLVQQASATLSKMKVAHDILGSKYTRGQCAVASRKMGFFLIESRQKLVASVDTLLSHKKRNALHFDVSKNWVVLIDEAHHALEDNKWSLLKEVLPNARFIGFTATPQRNDGRSLNSCAGGIFDRIIQAEKLKNNATHILIEEGYLSPYIAYSYNEREAWAGIGIDDTWSADEDTSFFCPESELNGDFIQHYRELANNKKALVMCTRINEAKRVRQKFVDAGISSACIHSNMPISDTTKILNDFRNGLFNVLCQVDMIGEGFDMPEIEVLIMLRKTNKMTYRQWCGRVLRPATGKTAIILDHAGNVIRHGLPDDPIQWHLDSPKDYSNQLTSCYFCQTVFNISKMKCSNCGEALEEAHLRAATSPEPEHVRIRKVRLYQYTKRQIAAAQNKEAYQKRLDNEIVLPSFQLSHRFVQVAHWFADNLAQSISFREVNHFISQPIFHSIDFYIDNFTLSDITQNNQKKCLKVYNKYKKNIKG